MNAGNRKARALAVMLSALLMVCLAGWGAGSIEQQSSPPQQTPPVAAPAVASAANPADVASIDAILRATYDTISGPAGQQREWNRFRSLFVSGHRLIPIVPDSKVEFHTLVLSVEDYVKYGDADFQKNGFFEHEVARRAERYRNMAQVFRRGKPIRRSPPESIVALCTVFLSALRISSTPPGSRPPTGLNPTATACPRKMQRWWRARRKPAPC